MRCYNNNIVVCTLVLALPNPIEFISEHKKEVVVDMQYYKNKHVLEK